MVSCSVHVCSGWDSDITFWHWAESINADFFSSFAASLARSKLKRCIKMWMKMHSLCNGMHTKFALNQRFLQIIVSADTRRRREERFWLWKCAQQLSLTLFWSSEEDGVLISAILLSSLSLDICSVSQLCRSRLPVHTEAELCWKHWASCVSQRCGDTDAAVGPPAWDGGKTEGGRDFF